ncbi:hypothetical protein BH24DEI2_BH24DEI2_23200 [soil metagenome]
MSARLAKVPAFFARSAGEQRLLLEALFTLASVRLGLSLLPFGVLSHLVQRPVRKTSNVELRAVTSALAAAGRYVPQATCLVKALAGQRLLAAHGHTGRLRLGVRKDGAHLQAHAWLEHGGRVVVGRVSNLADYHPLPAKGEGS